MTTTDTELESSGALLRLDGNWQFPEFGALTSRYTDIYAFFYALRSDVNVDQDSSRVLKKKVNGRDFLVVRTVSALLAR